MSGELSSIIPVLALGVTVVTILATIWWRIQTLINRVDDARRKDVQDLHAKIDTQRTHYETKLEGQSAVFIRRDEMLLHLGRIEDGMKDLGKRFDDMVRLFMQTKLNGGSNGSD